MMSVFAGEPLIKLIQLCYAANLPLLLYGNHGVGKSAILRQAADRLGISLVSCDLSLMDPPDLVGLPREREDFRTHYAPPAFLPTDGSGLLIFEELNRCPRHMQAPCLQLLTERQLNDYHLPDGWLPCAAVNDLADGYLVEELDSALRSRFVQVRVVPHPDHWLPWTRQNHLHEKVTDFIANSPSVFDDPDANPRAWEKVSRLLTTRQAGGHDDPTLHTAVAGVVNDKWAVAFLQFLSDSDPPLQPTEIVNDYRSQQGRVKAWRKEGRLDLIAASLDLLKRHIQPQRVYEGVVADLSQNNVERFFADLPAELKRQVRAWLAERRFDQLVIPPVG